MKRLIAVLLISCMMFSAAAADGLSGLTFEQLLVLRQEITAEIMSRPEWKEVEVPAGTWIIGEDIPAGVYSIRSTKGLNVVRVVDENDDIAGLYKTFDDDEIYGRVELLAGCTLTCNHALIFAPPVSLGC